MLKSLQQEFIEPVTEQIELPPEAFSIILNLLDFKSVLDSRLVNRSWYHLMVKFGPESLKPSMRKHFVYIIKQIFINELFTAANFQLKQSQELFISAREFLELPKQTQEFTMNTFLLQIKHMHQFKFESRSAIFMRTCSENLEAYRHDFKLSMLSNIITKNLVWLLPFAIYMY